MYRKEKCRLLLTRVTRPRDPQARRKEEEETFRLQKFEALWAIAEADRKWMALNQRKHRLQNAYSTMIERVLERSEEETEHWRGVLMVRPRVLGVAVLVCWVDNVFRSCLNVVWRTVLWAAFTGFL
jgi:hypothetical protein